MNIDLTLLFLKIFISSASTGPPRPPVQSKVLTLSIFFILTAPLISLVDPAYASPETHMRLRGRICVLHQKIKT